MTIAEMLLFLAGGLWIGSHLGITASIGSARSTARSPKMSAECPVCGVHALVGGICTWCAAQRRGAGVATGGGPVWGGSGNVATGGEAARAVAMPVSAPSGMTGAAGPDLIGIGPSPQGYGHLSAEQILDVARALGGPQPKPPPSLSEGELRVMAKAIESAGAFGGPPKPESPILPEKEVRAELHAAIRAAANVRPPPAPLEICPVCDEPMPGGWVAHRDTMHKPYRRPLWLRVLSRLMGRRTRP